MSSSAPKASGDMDKDMRTLRRRLHQLEKLSRRSLEDLTEAHLDSSRSGGSQNRTPRDKLLHIPKPNSGRARVRVTAEQLLHRRWDRKKLRGEFHVEVLRVKELYNAFPGNSLAQHPSLKIKFDHQNGISNKGFRADAEDGVNTEQPVFNLSFKKELTGFEKKMHLSIVHRRKLLRNIPIAEATIRIGQLIRHNGKPAWYQLYHTDNDEIEMPAGRIQLRVVWVPPVIISIDRVRGLSTENATLSNALRPFVKIECGDQSFRTEVGSGPAPTYEYDGHHTTVWVSGFGEEEFKSNDVIRFIVYDKKSLSKDKILCGTELTASFLWEECLERGVVSTQLYKPLPHSASSPASEGLSFSSKPYGVLSFSALSFGDDPDDRDSVAANLDRLAHDHGKRRHKKKGKKGKKKEGKHSRLPRPPMYEGETIEEENEEEAYSPRSSRRERERERERGEVESTTSTHRSSKKKQSKKKKSKKKRDLPPSDSLAALENHDDSEDTDEYVDRRVKEMSREKRKEEREKEKKRREKEEKQLETEIKEVEIEEEAPSASASRSSRRRRGGRRRDKDTKDKKKKEQTTAPAPVPPTSLSLPKSRPVVDGEYIDSSEDEAPLSLSPRPKGQHRVELLDDIELD